MSEQVNRQTTIKDKIREEFIKCATDPVYFMKKYYMIQHPQKGRQLFDLYPFQESMMKVFTGDKNVIINKSRQLGISTLVSAYSLWLMLFHKDKNVLVIATKQETAKNMVTKVRFAYDNLPSWLKIGTTEDNRLSLRLTNGSQIKAVSGASDSARSEAVSLLAMDEAAFIDNAEELFGSAQQTLATGGKCIALSTPNGVGNWFHKTYSRAQKKENSFVPVSLPWTVHPDRNQEWRDQQDKDLGLRMAAQECDCDFSSSGATVIIPDILAWYEENVILEPIERRGLDRSLWIWEYPSPMKTYLLTADVARGDGGDYSAFHIIDIETLTQVAEFQSQCDTREYANIIIAAASEYNNALVAVENANIGWDVLQSLIERGYNNLHYSHKSDTSLDAEKHLDRFDNSSTLVPGFTTSTKSRPLIVERMRDFVETKQVVIRSIRLLEELRVFIWKNSKAQAMSGYNDDLVMSFAIGMYMRDSSIRFKRNAESLTYASLNSFTRTTDNTAVYNASSHLNSNPWAMEVQHNAGSSVEDLSWLIG
jgi:hypothetical protein